MTKTLDVEIDVIPTVFYCYHLDLGYVQKEVKKRKYTKQIKLPSFHLHLQST